MDERFSKEDARRIFAAAAQRQHEDRAAAEERLTLAEMEEAGRAAGLDPAYIRAAAADLLRPERAPAHRTFLGVPAELRRTRTLAAPMDEATWARCVAAFRDVFGREGLATNLGETRTWISGTDERRMPVRITYETEGDGARVTVERKQWPRVLGLTLGTAINGAMGLVLLLIWLLAGMQGDEIIPALILLGFAALFGSGAFFGLRRESRKKIEQFEAALRAVARETAPARSDAVPERRSGLLDGLPDAPEAPEATRADRGRVR